MAPTETLFHAFSNHQGPLISHGLPFLKAYKKHIDERFRASRVYIICSGSVAKNTLHLKDLQHVLGARVAGVRFGMKSHTIMSEVLEIIADARRPDADLIVTLGGGNLIDGAKAVATVC